MNKEEYSKYLKSEHWLETRQKRIDLDDNRCYICGKRKYLNVHHIRYNNLGHEDVNSDLITLCKQCHSMLHKIKDGTKEEYYNLLDARRDGKYPEKESKAYLLFRNRIKDQIMEQMWIRDIQFGGDLRVFDNGVRVVNKILKVISIIYPSEQNLNIENNIRNKVKKISFKDINRKSKRKKHRKKNAHKDIGGKMRV